VSFLNTILDIVFPVNCVGCKKSGVILCENCLSGSPNAERESAPWIFPIYDYRHPIIKKSIWMFKYNNKRKFADIFGIVLHERIIEELSELEVMENFREPLLIPIPLSHYRLKERGYNQALLLCKKIIELGSGNLKLEKGVLIKPKETMHQAKIENRSARLKNIVGSFTVKNPEIIKNRNIILIDDVTTTGATLTEARKILKQSGAKKIVAFTVAH